ncbi:NlpC/P60 family protein [Pediococcus argentinicus]|uniref:C40 family peptidase n=1 Tax=Pediococcus argentinicus TaxID=480391 RepID=UPI00338E053D
MKKAIKYVVLLVAAFAVVFVSSNKSNQVFAASKPTYSKLYKTAKSKLHAHYSYGAVGPNCFDCSGYTKYIYKKSVKKNLPRTAQSQYQSFKKVSVQNRKPGDLVFFGGSKRSISHVGIYVGKGLMINAQNRGVVLESVSAHWWHAVGYSRPANLK